MDLTTKELTAIEEQLGQEQLLILCHFGIHLKFLNHQLFLPKLLKTTCEQIAAKHEIHKNKLINLLG